MMHSSLTVRTLFLSGLVAGMGGTPIVGQDPAVEPKTVPEASGYTKTSTHGDVLAFLAKLAELPHAKRLRQETFGTTVEGRDLPLVIVSEPPLPAASDARRAAIRESGKLRLFVMANIHAGEIEGKEAVQILLRELAQGQHEKLLAHAILFFAPIYNADGNDRMNARNRSRQNGPDGPVGQRSNADGYDLNRDLVKIDTPECRALLGVFRTYDPHLFMDLHTTNGSSHGYHLTYAPSLSPNVDPDLSRFARKTLLAGVRTAVKVKHGFRIYDYGNFPRRSRDRWVTYDHRARYATNYYGLRNRIAVLSEAFAYVAYPNRIRVTRALVLETLRACVRERSTLAELCRAADVRMTNPSEALRFGYATKLEEPREDEVLLGRLTRRPGTDGRTTRIVSEDWFEAKKMPVQTAFVATEHVPYPYGWAIPKASDAVVFALLDHGLQVKALSRPAAVVAGAYEILEANQSTRPYQKHKMRSFEVAPKRRKQTLPAGTIFVSARQPLARLGAQLLEAVSEDSLATWNYFDAAIPAIEPNPDGSFPEFPVLRVEEEPVLTWKRVLATEVAGKRVRILK